MAQTTDPRFAFHERVPQVLAPYWPKWLIARFLHQPDPSGFEQCAQFHQIHASAAAYGEHLHVLLDHMVGAVLAQHFDFGIVGMPHAGGYELASRIRAEVWGSKLVLLTITGWGHADDKRRALAAGFDKHLTKPASPDLVTAALARYW